LIYPTVPHLGCSSSFLFVDDFEPAHRSSAPPQSQGAKEEDRDNATSEDLHSAVCQRTRLEARYIGKPTKVISCQSSQSTKNAVMSWYDHRRVRQNSGPSCDMPGVRLETVLPGTISRLQHGTETYR
jgi:hypothetical protein